MSKKKNLYPGAVESPGHPYRYEEPAWCEFCKSYDCSNPNYWGGGELPISMFLDELMKGGDGTFGYGKDAG